MTVLCLIERDGVDGLTDQSQRQRYCARRHYRFEQIADLSVESRKAHRQVFVLVRR